MVTSLMATGLDDIFCHLISAATRTRGPKSVTPAMRILPTHEAILSKFLHACITGYIHELRERSTDT